MSLVLCDPQVSFLFRMPFGVPRSDKGLSFYCVAHSDSWNGGCCWVGAAAPLTGPFSSLFHPR